MSVVFTGRSEPSGDPIESVGFLCLACLCAATGIAFAVSEANPSSHPVRFVIEDTINPNDALPASLARLPRIGPARAREIVSYRNRFSEAGGQWPAFGRAEDLERVTGIGPATVEAVRPWLSFDSHTPGQQSGANRP